MSKDEKNWRINHIHMRLPNLIPSINRISMRKDPPSQIDLPSFPPAYPPRKNENALPPYQIKQIAQYHNHNCDVQPFQASPKAIDLVQQITGSESYYTISLRTSHFQPTRNSQLDEWFKVYEYLKTKGFNVFVIPDFEDMTSARQAREYDWELAEFATYELDLRLALYKGAVDNLCVNNGVAQIMSFSKVPFKMFKMITDGISTTSEKFITGVAAISKGESPIYFRPDQRWVWQDDTFENISGALSL